MAFYTLVPEDSIAVVNGEVAEGVDFTGIDPTIHAVQWYDVVGNIEYVFDPITGEKLPNEQITDIATFQSYITDAEEIIFAQNNPVTYYVISNEIVYGGETYFFGEAVIISTPNPVQPDFTTAIVPPTPQSWQELFWYDDAWVISSVNPDLPLAEAQSFLITAAQTSAAEQGNNEARIYSASQLFSAADRKSVV